MAKIFLADHAASVTLPFVTERARVSRHGLFISRYSVMSNSSAWIGATQMAIVMHEGEPFDVTWRSHESKTAEQLIVGPGQFHMAPADMPVHLSWRGTPRVMTVALASAFIETTVGAAFDGKIPEIPARPAIRDTTVEGLMTNLRAAMRKDCGLNGLRLDHLGALLAVHLFEIYGEGVKAPPRVHGGLGVSRQRRIVEYIEEHLTEDIGLERLAAEVALGQHHFGKAFKESLGRSPWRYVSERRIHRAKEMLLSEHRSITEIAHDLGFSSHSHLSEAFRRVTGMTPSEFRKKRD
jgi:AraC family transcriptional regulator